MTSQKQKIIITLHALLPRQTRDSRSLRACQALEKDFYDANSLEAAFDTPLILGFQRSLDNILHSKGNQTRASLLVHLSFALFRGI
jgi:hypothetical protein